MRALLITPLPMTVQLIEIDDELEVYQKLVHGYIEIVHAVSLRPYSAAMVVNEEGVLLDLPCNPLATVLYGDYIAGDAVLVGTSGPDFTDVSLQLLEKIYNMIGRGEQND